MLSAFSRPAESAFRNFSDGFLDSDCKPLYRGSRLALSARIPRANRVGLQMPVIVTAELEVCHACACLIANGEVGDLDETEAQIARIEAHYGPSWGAIVLACNEDECDHVGIGCDACGVADGYVMVHPAVVLTQTRTVAIPRSTQHLTSVAAWAEINACEGVREISDACAATIASWWQAPRGPAATFAALASGCSVTVAELCDAIAYERTQISGYGPVADSDRRALDMLATWAINRHRGEAGTA